MRILLSLGMIVLAACRHEAASPDAVLRSARELLRAERYQEALAQAESGSARAAQTHDRTYERRFRILKAEILLARREMPQALAALGSDVPEGTEWSEWRGRALLVRAQAAYLLSHYSEARELLSRADEEARRSGSPALASEVDLRRGSLLVRMGRFDQANAQFRKVVAAASRTRDAYLEASAMGNLGYLFLTSSRYDEAISWFEKARTLFRKMGAADSVARATGNLGSCYLRLGDYGAAQREFEQAQAAFAKTGNRFEQQARIGAAGAVLFETGDYAGAAEQYQRALAISRQLPNDLWTARWLNNLANTSIELGDFAAAEKYNNEALALKRRLPGTRSEIYSIYNAARIAVARKHFREAETLFQDALRQPAEDPTIVLDAHAGLADLYVQTNRPRRAEAEFRSTLAAIDRRSAGLSKDEYKFSYVASLIRFYSGYIDFLMAKQEPLRALEVAESSRSRVLAERSGRSEAVTMRTARDYQRLARDTNATLVEYWLGTRQSYVWVIGPNGVRHFVLPSTHSLGPLLENYRAVIMAQRNALEVAGDTGRRLYEALLAPVERASAATRFIIVPDENLYSLNFEALPGGGGGYWIERATVALAPSLNYLAANARAELPPGRPALLAIGDPAAAMTEYPRLDFAAREIASIAKRMSGAEQKLIQGEAARPPAYAAAQPARFRFIHFAAHAAANPNSPLDSAVILSGAPENCKLFARDVMAVPLTADLVTISACRSAGARTYAGEGLVGFAWAFLSAGARNVIAGLWDVNDRSTAELMQSLYTQIATGAPPADALRAAKLALIHGGGSYAKPYYWAPFQLYMGAFR
ncbi:MAG TPA: CHAT domain-containing protein [Bryobacteraceae bacterium]|nr:CHAT domain-containing protein [Bryobacteraceae bacterium]